MRRPREARRLAPTMLVEPTTTVTCQQCSNRPSAAAEWATAAAAVCCDLCQRRAIVSMQSSHSEHQPRASGLISARARCCSCCDKNRKVPARPAAAAGNSVSLVPLVSKYLKEPSCVSGAMDTLLKCKDTRGTWTQAPAATAGIFLCVCIFRGTPCVWAPSRNARIPRLCVHCKSVGARRFFSNRARASHPNTRVADPAASDGR
jgi:hypothetical protein